MLHAGATITLIKDCNALLIPSATPITIPSGTNVQITQTKGGSVTVIAGGNLARIDGKDLDALGIDISDNGEKDKNNNEAISSDKVAKIITGDADINLVWDALKTCFDPEIPVNIVDLGLVYECKSSSNHVEIKMTLTAPGCGMGPVIVGDVEQKVLALKNVSTVTVELVFEPQWNQDMMSPAAKLELGLL